MSKHLISRPRPRLFKPACCKNFGIPRNSKKVHWENTFASRSERPSCLKLNLYTQGTPYLLFREAYSLSSLLYMEYVLFIPV